jgi:glycerophosphoryl diester phosphodiesterase
MSIDLVSAVSRGLLNIAHRGARSLAPENTLSAGRKALSLGADMWEVDVRLSRDGCPVVVHDATLERISDATLKFPRRKPWYVHDFSLEELRSLDFGSWFNRDDPFGQIAAKSVTAFEQSQYCGERILTLEEALVFTADNDWLINVEIKNLPVSSGNGDIVKKVGELVVSLSTEDRCIISSFNHTYLSEVKRVSGKIRTGVLVDGPHHDLRELMLSLHAFSCHPGLRALRPKEVANLKETGFVVLVWVVNDQKLAGVLRRRGVNGIFTDFPQNFLKAANQDKHTT